MKLGISIIIECFLVKIPLTNNAFVEISYQSHNLEIKNILKNDIFNNYNNRDLYIISDMQNNIFQSEQLYDLSKWNIFLYKLLSNQSIYFSSLNIENDFINCFSSMNKQEKLKAEEEKKLKEQKKKQAERKLEKIKKKETGKIKHNISLENKKWIKMSEYNSSYHKKLTEDFNKRATQLCLSTGNFNILKRKVEIIEIDETPAIGLEPVLKIGISGTIECN